MDVCESNQLKLNRSLLYIKEELNKRKNKEAVERVDRCIKMITTTPLCMSISKLHDLLKICNEFIHEVYTDE
jgi:hypothetical protein